MKLSQIIESGNWYHVDCISIFGEHKYRVRLRNFSKVDFSDVDYLEKVFPGEDYDHVDIWLLQLDVVNLCKRPMSGYAVKNSIMIVDQDGYEYKYYTLGTFHHWSEYSKKTGMPNLDLTTDHNPKIKFIGAIAFKLPAEDDAEYYIEIDSGSMSEI